jgi:hypothetical protein
MSRNISQKKTIFYTILITSLLFASVASGIISYVITIPTTGTISTVGIGIYNDPAATINVTAISWGILTPNQSTQKLLYIKNTNLINCVVTLTENNWNPTNAHEYMTISWNYSGQTLTPSMILPVTVTLSLYDNASAIMNFGFDMIFTAT